jgi:hypothetical protein
MERGSINEHYVRVKLRSQKEPILRGPYYVISRRGEKKTVGYHLKTPEALMGARRAVAAHHRFRELCREFEAVTEELGRRLVPAEDASPEKKRRRSRSSKTRR